MRLNSAKVSTPFMPGSFTSIHDVEVARAEQGDPFLSAARELNRIAAHVQDVGDALRVVAVVVDDKHPEVHAAISWLCGSGSRTMARVPTPSALVSSISPPCCSTICLTVGRPSPVPKLLVLKSGSKIRGRTSGA